jgi:hypothetical protein
MNQNLPQIMRQDNQNITRMKTNETWPCMEQRERFLADGTQLTLDLGPT